MIREYQGRFMPLRVSVHDVVGEPDLFGVSVSALVS